ncbi:MAG TPA: epoxide hydrolase [Myxococcales bacterium]|nr:epoxide hydrolase [Myxococcales bacterium]
MDIRRFTVDVPEHVLTDLNDRLARTRWPDEIEGAGWEYGVDRSYLLDLAEYWQDQFSWRDQEQALNALPHFKATIDGLSIHFVHARATAPNALPLILTHGWPGSFIEMVELIPRLTNPERDGGDARDAFDVVIPSLPGYGFSDRPTAPGMTPGKIAEMWHALMQALGYLRYGAQGGDWGASVATRLAMQHPAEVIGIHLNYIPGSYVPYLGQGSRELDVEERGFLDAAKLWTDQEGAYAHLQSTRPQTATYSLNDSPVGLLAWIVEKLRDWSDCGGQVERRFTRDVLLANVTLYWITQTIGSSMRLYKEARAAPLRFGRDEKVPVPCGVAHFPVEAPMPPRSWVERHYDVQRWTAMPSGGHFAALEEPKRLAEDIRDLFRPFRR